MTSTAQSHISRVAIADDHPAILAALRIAIEQQHTLQLCVIASDGKQLLDALQRTPCDVVITDFSMGDDSHGGSKNDGFSLLERLQRHYPDVCLIVFTMLTNPGIVKRLQQLQVHAIVSKKDAIEHVLKAVQFCRNGQQYFSPDIHRQLPINEAHASQAQPQGEHSGQALTKRELEVLRLFAAGLHLSEIAEKLNRAPTTVATHKMNAMQKLNIDNNADLILYAYENRLV